MSSLLRPVSWLTSVGTGHEGGSGGFPGGAGPGDEGACRYGEGSRRGGGVGGWERNTVE